MTDLTKIKTPFGLLKKKTRTAMLGLLWIDVMWGVL